MNPVTVRSPNAAASFEFLSQHLNVPFGHDFMAAKTLLAIIEAAAPRMNEVDQVQLGRLIVSTGHAIALSCRGTRAHDGAEPLYRAL